MKNLKSLCILSVVAVGLSLHTPSGLSSGNEDLQKEDLVKGNNAFAVDLYGRLSKSSGNLFFSPYSISTALAMTFGGAKGNTEKQIATVLHFNMPQNVLHMAFENLQVGLNDIQQKGNIQLSIANSLWPQEGYRFLDAYLQLTKTHYNVDLIHLDYRNDAEGARKTINLWVEDKTQQKIRDLIQPGMLNALTRMVLTNAIYFLGNWEKQFDENFTRPQAFYLQNGKTVETPMMSIKDHCFYTENDEVQVLEKLYKGRDLSMVVILPREKGGLPVLESGLNLAKLDQWIGNRPMQNVQVLLPKFTMNSQFSLGETLSSMGMPDAFTSKADFSGMDGTKNLFISAVVHKAFVAVDEVGTEAAAATGAMMTLTSAPRPAPVFRADHPFIFMIRHIDTGSILFLGRVMDPSE